MTSEKRTVPGYRRHGIGASAERYVGVEARLDAGGDAKALEATWFIADASIGGMKPRPGDLCWGTDGIVRTVKTVGDLNEAGEWEVVLAREPAPARPGA